MCNPLSLLDKSDSRGQDPRMPETSDPLAPEGPANDAARTSNTLAVAEGLDNAILLVEGIRQTIEKQKSDFEKLVLFDFGTLRSVSAAVTAGWVIAEAGLFELDNLMRVAVERLRETSPPTSGTTCNTAPRAKRLERDSLLVAEVLRYIAPVLEHEYILAGEMVRDMSTDFAACEDAAIDVVAAARKAVDGGPPVTKVDDLCLCGYRLGHAGPCQGVF